MGYETASYILAALTSTGGTIGYIKGKSVPSLAAGCSIGLLYAIGGYRTQTSQTYGVETSLLASVILGGASIPRAIRLRKPVPMALGVLAVLGMLTFGTAFAGNRKA